MNDDKLIIKSSSNNNNNNNKRKIWANENHFGSSVSISSPILLIQIYTISWEKTFSLT